MTIRGYTCEELGVRDAKSPTSCPSRHAHRMDVRHHTGSLPTGGFYFAPGAIEQHSPRRKARRLTGWQRLVRDCAVLLAVLAVLALVGYVALMLHAKGWPL